MNTLYYMKTENFLVDFQAPPCIHYLEGYLVYHLIMRVVKKSFKPEYELFWIIFLVFSQMDFGWH